MEVINHFSHEEHPLILKEMQVDDDGLEKADCYGCKQPVSSGSTTHYYYCSECNNVFLHKSCAELPLEITHPMHPQHILALFAKPSYSTGSCFCNICRRVWSGFTYECSKCEFDLDVLCAQMTELSFKHPGHPHPLKYLPRSALFECDACGVEDKDESYNCTVCSFWIHKSCGSMTSITSVTYHNHPLSLAYCLPEQYLRYGFNCDICKGKLHLSYWVYYCSLCRYFIHLKCMTSKSQEDQPTDNNDEEIIPNVITLPVENLSYALIKHYLEQNGLPQLLEPLSEIEHFTHQHPLILTTVEDDYYEFTEDDQETVCSACVEPISGSCYTCVGCNFFIHIHCAQLPVTISSTHHLEHTLSLLYPKNLVRVFRCNKCRCYCNGLVYGCIDCKFCLDIKCALFPTRIKHKAHEHLLVDQRESSKEICSGCRQRHEDIFFHCETCVYKLATGCAMFPKTVGHRWDKHSLVMSFPPFDYHPDEFTCDECEEECHPKYPLYHCRECNNSFHLHCHPRHDDSRNMKFGGKLEIDYHPHPLTFKRYAEYKFSCHKCATDLQGKVHFECEPCYFTICYPCVYDIVDSSL